MIRLVVNADDLGLHPRIDEGILRAHREGIVTSASLLATARYAAGGIAGAKAQGLPLGLHLCVTTHLTPAAPAADVRWLAPGGRFRKDWREFAMAWLSGLIPSSEVEREMEAQLERARHLGADIDHLDTHQHVHLLPGMARVVEGIAQRHGLALRWPIDRPRISQLANVAQLAKTTILSTLGRVRPARSAKRVKAVGVYESGGLTEKRLLRLLERLGDGDVELMCHPGLAPGAVSEDPHWRYDWESEMEALCSPRVKQLVRKREIALVSYRSLSA